MEVNDGHQTPNQMDLGESWHSWSQSCKMQSLETLKLRGWDKNKSRVLGSSRRLYDWTWCRSPRSKTEQTLTATLESKQQSCWYQTEVLARFPPLPSLTAAQQTTRGFLPNQTASLPSSIRKTHTRALEDNRIPSSAISVTWQQLNHTKHKLSSLIVFSTISKMWTNGNNVGSRTLCGRLRRGLELRPSQRKPKNSDDCWIHDVDLLKNNPSTAMLWEVNHLLFIWFLSAFSATWGRLRKMITCTQIPGKYQRHHEMWEVLLELSRRRGTIIFLLLW